MRCTAIEYGLIAALIAVAAIYAINCLDARPHHALTAITSNPDGSD